MSDKIPDIIHRTIDAVMAERAEILRNYAISFSFVTHSPIEWAFLLAFYEIGDWQGLSAAENRKTADEVMGADVPEGLFVVPQAQLGPYRVDFLIVLSSGGAVSRIVVECDGHDFHERTKAQAAKDKSRDRGLLEMGLPVLRFTGSEIYASAVDCAQQVYNILRSAWSDRFTIQKAAD